MLTLGDPTPVLRDAWPQLSGGDAIGLRRLCRLIDQRLRDGNRLVRLVAVEPVVELLLDSDTPWAAGDHVQELLCDWLRALVIANTSAGHPLRVRLRERLTQACDAADRRLADERAAAAAARRGQSPEEMSRGRRFRERHPDLFVETGYPRLGRRRRRPEIPIEITREIVVELFAMLGPDLGEAGEAILRRIAQDAPFRLAPAVEALLAGRAIATYRRGLLAELTEAYYLDDEEDGSGFHEDGIRDHQVGDFGFGALAAWYRGPFMALFQFDFTSGVAVLNRMLNHAARARARALTRLSAAYDVSNDADDALGEHHTELAVTGVRRTYIGDAHVWYWHRGTGVGPYPCVSALLALERVCDQLIEADVPVARIVDVLLDGCENLAIVGLVVGILMRHLERAGRLIDPYLVEPDIWHLEFARMANESSGLAADSTDPVHAERRQWSLRETSTALVMRADDTRAAELRAVGDQLVDNARRIFSDALPASDGDLDIHREAVLGEQLIPVRSWASGLDRHSYTVQQTDRGLYIQSEPPDDVAHALQRRNEDLRPVHEETRLLIRYHIRPRRNAADDPVTSEELVADLTAAESLLRDLSTEAVGTGWDAPTAVAATAVSATLLHGQRLPDASIAFAVETLLRVGAGAAPPRQYEYAETYFEPGADRSAARVLPLLLLPTAAPLLALVDGANCSPARDRVIAAATNLARAVAGEVRLHLARSLDNVWRAPCVPDGECHHEVVLRLALDTMRDCGLGAWESGRRPTLVLDNPVEAALVELPDNAIHPARLDAAIRALAPAAAAHRCISVRARAAFDIALAAHRRSLLVHEHGIDDRGTHALVAARALLTLAPDDPALILEHVDAFADAPSLLGNFLRALSGAAEETHARAETARRWWPRIVNRVLDLAESGHAPFNDRPLGRYTRAALMPNPAGDASYLYRELGGDPIAGWKPTGWQEVIDRWLPFAAGDPGCVDHLVILLGRLPAEHQVRFGLSRVATLVLANPGNVARQAFMPTQWLIDMGAALME